VFVTVSVIEYPAAPGAGETVPFIGMDAPPPTGAAYEAALVCTLTVVPAANEKKGAKERRRIAAIASTLVPPIFAANPRLWTEFSVFI